MGICLYRGVSCIRSANDYEGLETANVIGKVVYSNALEIARSETVPRKGGGDASGGASGGASGESPDDDDILLVAACYKTGDEAPFTIQLVSNVSGVVLVPAPAKNTGTGTSKKTKQKNDGGKKKKTKKAKKMSSSGFGAAKNTVSNMSSMYGDL